MEISHYYKQAKLVKEETLKIGCIDIPHTLGSRLDVLLEAILLAIRLASDSKNIYKYINREQLLITYSKDLIKKGYSINNIDSTVFIERPKLRPYIANMVDYISNLIGIHPSNINIKAKTNEGIAFIGNNQEIAASASIAYSNTTNKLRVGVGYDIHKMANDIDLYIGGYQIPYYMGCIGHSKADVLLHAISDAILGASGSQDLGTWFPNTDDINKHRCSRDILKSAHKISIAKGMRLISISASIHLYSDIELSLTDIARRISIDLGVYVDNIHLDRQSINKPEDGYLHYMFSSATCILSHDKL